MTRRLSSLDLQILVELDIFVLKKYKCFRLPLLNFTNSSREGILALRSVVKIYR